VLCVVVPFPGFPRSRDESFARKRPGPWQVTPGGANRLAGTGPGNVVPAQLLVVDRRPSFRRLRRKRPRAVNLQIGYNTAMFENLRPHMVVRRLWEVDINALKARGIQAVMLDLDNTLTLWRSLDVPQEGKAWMQAALDAGLQACIVSNAATARRVRPVAEQFGIQWVTRALKPLSGGFRRALALLGTTPATTAIIGDQMFTDVLGGKLTGIRTVLITPMSSADLPHTLVLRRIERVLLAGRTPLP